jgi:hypothetical protein
MERKRFCLELEREGFQAADTPKFDWLSQRARGPQGSLGNSQVERIPQRPGATDILRRQIGDRAILLALEMQPLRLYLSKMNFHGRNPPGFIA